MKRAFVAVPTAVAVFFAGAPVVSAVTNPDGTVTFSISNFTDFHGNLTEDARNGMMGAGKLAAMVEQANVDQDYILTTSGDNIGGSAFVSGILDDQPTIDAMNAMDVDVTVVGNHEFDAGTDRLLNEVIPQHPFPMLGGNVNYNGEHPLDTTEVIEIDGVRVAFIGTVTQKTATKVTPSSIEGVTFDDIHAVTNAEADRLVANDEADIIVALTHEDAEELKDGFNDNVDILLGGDSHQPYSGVVERDGSTPLYYAQSWEYGKMLTDMDITFDPETREIVDLQTTLYTYEDAADLEPHAEVQAIVDKAVADSSEIGNQALATVPEFIGRGRNADGTENRGTESTLNNLIATANRDALSKVYADGIDIGLMNAGGVRADLEAGEATYQDAFTINPFGNTVDYGFITGDQVYALMNTQFGMNDDGSEYFSSIGLSDNVTFTYDPNRPVDDRVTSLTINGELVDRNAEYSVAASNHLFSGNPVLQNARGHVNVGVSDVMAFADYLKENDPVAAPTAQTGVGIILPEDITAGEEVTIDLTSLAYSLDTDPQADEVTVELAGATATATIDSMVYPEDKGHPEQGRATVTFTVPADAVGDQVLTVTTDSGTTAQLPVTVAAAAEQPDPAPAPAPSQIGSDLGSSGPTGIFAIVGLFLAIFAAVGLTGIVAPGFLA